MNLCIIIGDPITHSLSPQMHNAGYKALGIEKEFLFLKLPVKKDDLKGAMKLLRIMNVRGITVTMPHKIDVLKYVDVVDEIAEKIGAINTIVNDNGKLIGYNTDHIGITTPLLKITKLEGKKVALLGAGGASRAILYGLTKEKAKITLYNRTLEKAKEVAKGFDIEVKSLEEIESIKNSNIIINATSLGMHPHEDLSPIPEKCFEKHHIVFDIIYAPHETKFLRDAKEKGATIIHGTEMLLYQGMEQFKLYTGKDAPEEVVRNILIVF